MAKRNTSTPPEPGPPRDAWVVSFSDCMTNLLCFFVLLVSFSSFDVSAQGRIQGAFTAMSSPAISDRRTDPTDAIVPPRPRPFDPTVEGAEKPTNEPPEPVRKTRNEIVPDIDAIHDQVTIRVPAGRCFWGDGYRLRPEGQSDLAFIASYMNLLPVRAVVRVSGPSGSADQMNLNRAWAIVACMTGDGRISSDRICIAAAEGPGTEEPSVEILLLRKEVIR